MDVYIHRKLYKDPFDKYAQCDIFLCEIKKKDIFGKPQQPVCNYFLGLPVFIVCVFGG